jgi:methionine sulfoxide reductase heme-binding subunit
MQHHPSRLSGWPFVGWCSLALIAIFTALLAVYGTGETGVRTVVRHSAQTSFLLFISAFVASAAYRQWPRPATRWMLTNRRYLGVSFAVSHFLHLLALIALARVSQAFVDGLSVVALVGGGIAYVFIVLMVATSFDRSAAWLGARAWRRLHTAGMYYIWLIFLQSYLPRALRSPVYAPFVIILLAALGLRLATIAARRQRVVVVS